MAPQPLAVARAIGARTASADRTRASARRRAGRGGTGSTVPGACIVARRRPAPRDRWITVPVVRRCAATCARRGTGTGRRASAPLATRSPTVVAEREQREAAAEVIEQPLAARDRPPARRPPARPAPSRRRRPRNPHRSGVLSGESASTAGTDSRPLLTSLRANAMLLRELEHRVAKRARHRALRRDEVGRRASSSGCSRRPRARARDRRCRAAAPAPCRRSTSVELPDEIVGILEAAVRAARAERAHDVRGIAGEQHAAVAEMLHAPALERVDARPFDLEFARRARASRAAAAGCAPAASRLSGSASQPSWKSTRHTSSACRCSSADWFGMERRIEPEPALGREIGLHVDVGDQEAVAEHLPFRTRARASAAPGCARRRTTIEPVARERVFAVAAWRRRRRRRRRPARTPMTLFFQRRSSVGSSPRALDEELLEPVLLQVDERRPAMARSRAAGRTGTTSSSRKNTLPTFQPMPLSTIRCAAAEPVEDLERALRIADRARAHATPCRRRRARPRERRAARDRSPPRGPTGPAPTTTTGTARAARRRARARGGSTDRRGSMYVFIGVTARQASVRASRDAFPLVRLSLRRSALQRLPHLLVALRRPDARIAGIASPRRRRASRRTAGNGRRSPSGRTSASARRRSRL